jgi:hypothetical protein
MPPPESVNHQDHTSSTNSDSFASSALEPAAAEHSNKSPKKHAKKQPKTPKKRGRPTVFDQQKRHGFCIMIQMGCSVRAAAAHLGIDKQSVEYARRHDPDFDAEVRTAEHSRNMNLLGHVVSAGSRSWRASAWLLAAVQPELYAAHRRRGAAATPVARNEKRLKQFVMGVVVEVLTDCIQNQAKQGRDFFAKFRRPQTSDDPAPATASHAPTDHDPDDPPETPAEMAVAAIDERLAEIEAESKCPPKQYPALENFWAHPANRDKLPEHIAKMKKILLRKHGSKRKSNNANDKQQSPSA